MEYFTCSIVRMFDFGKYLYFYSRLSHHINAENKNTNCAQIFPLFLVWISLLACHTNIVQWARWWDEILFMSSATEFFSQQFCCSIFHLLYFIFSLYIFVWLEKYVLFMFWWLNKRLNKLHISSVPNQKQLHEHKKREHSTCNLCINLIKRCKSRENPQYFTIDLVWSAFSASLTRLLYFHKMQYE